jgi:putative oxidoreductase
MGLSAAILARSRSHYSIYGKTMPDPSSEQKFVYSWKDWTVRVVIALLFLFTGTGKFTSSPGAAWFDLYSQIGFGQWFRYFTGVLEVLGAVLIIGSRTVTVGLMVLGCVMVGAGIVFATVLHHPADGLVPFAVMCAMASFWLHRRRKASSPA